VVTETSLSAYAGTCRQVYATDMGPYGLNLSVQALAEAEEKSDALLRAARESFPDHDIYETFGGYMAVPKGTVIIQSTEIDALVGKLRESLRQQ
jgi:hypothetical protein